MPLCVKFHVVVGPSLAYMLKPSLWDYLITYVLCNTSKCRGMQGCSVCHKYRCDTALLVLIFYMLASTHRKEFALTSKCIQHNMWKSTVYRWILRPICFQDHPRSIAYIQNPIGSQKPANSQRLLQFAAHFMVIQAETSVAEHVVLFVVAIISIIEHSLTGMQQLFGHAKRAAA